YRTDERMMIEADIISGGRKVDSIPALNEVVLERGTLSRVISIRVSVGDEPIATYIADGFIVSTPSGSTAYSLSAGGPVLEPQLEAMVLTAVSPHWPLWRSIVVGPQRPVTLLTPKDSAAFSADGATVKILEPGTSVVVAPSPRRLKLISLKGLRFYDRLRIRFHQPDPDL
ncbi:MAG: NAD(+)/NADH kinase, partial [Actinomycetota bacterium]